VRAGGYRVSQTATANGRSTPSRWRASVSGEQPQRAGDETAAEETNAGHQQDGDGDRLEQRHEARREGGRREVLALRLQEPRIRALVVDAVGVTGRQGVRRQQHRSRPPPAAAGARVVVEVVR
jgi:hypothetical protein